MIHVVGVVAAAGGDGGGGGGFVRFVDGGAELNVLVDDNNTAVFVDG